MAGALATSATSGCSSKAQAAARRIARGAGLDRTQIVDLDDPEQAADLRWQESRGPCHMQARGADTAMSNRGTHGQPVTADGDERVNCRLLHPDGTLGTPIAAAVIGVDRSRDPLW